jgi:hypothetical protein
LPAIPEPALVVIGAESDCIAADHFGIWRHEADRTSAVEVTDYDKETGPSGFFSRHARASRMSSHIKLVTSGLLHEANPPQAPTLRLFYSVAVNVACG